MATSNKLKAVQETNGNHMELEIKGPNLISTESVFLVTLVSCHTWIRNDRYSITTDGNMCVGVHNAGFGLHTLMKYFIPCFIGRLWFYPR